MNSQDNVVQVFLTKGYHRIKIEQFKGTGKGYITLQWGLSNESLETIPPGYFSLSPKD
jgi:hypothetical protein